MGWAAVRAGGAGTGKTRALTHRIAYGIEQGKYQPDHVLALTFTAKAASEMGTRLTALGVRGVAARTFHSAALRQLQHFWPTVTGGRLPDISGSKGRLVAKALEDTPPRGGHRNPPRHRRRYRVA